LALVEKITDCPKLLAAILLAGSVFQGTVGLDCSIEEGY
jgi:hypothetical protein